MAKKTGENKLIKLIKQSWQWVIMLLLLGFQLTLFFVILYRIMPVPVTPLHLVRVYEQLRDGKEVKLKKDWTSIDYVSEKFCLAVITAEDAKFNRHYGFDFEQIQNSIERGLKRGKKLRGASTISQQTAKNLFFTPKRSWIRKVPEVIITLTLELLWTKKRILEVYINIIEMGDGIYGAEAAALYYFQKPSSKLTSRESSLIAACLPNPRKWKANKPTSYINRKANRIQNLMHYIGELPWKETAEN
ncbi:MAG: monofunctional biosynthetic peptidoglycan transglycosylase [Bacteroidia bacterium]|jgi:monofunctional biosynthetic peptidoglycan transglycosylase|nr:monofunctional biosynthetic peptidoglycan transglycosylase [Bacteroidia bacterium]